MSPPNARSIFEDASELPTEARGAFIEEACAGVASLKAEVESLLRAFDQAIGFLDRDAEHETADADPNLGTRIGPYVLESVVGQGGFGTVYRARQDEPISRTVALKVIRRGMDSDRIIARFRSEQEALALMSHTNIARVLDAGTTDDGQPYFVMEFVDGVPITEYCDTHRLPAHERLRLLSQVCLAVQHAHQRGVLHRDLKPGNVLVADEDGRAVPKVIDFGIAKAMVPNVEADFTLTHEGQLIGTPQYMSPEQASGSRDVDTRTDVYSLGVLLYELLTGTTPIRRKTLRAAAAAEIGRILNSAERPKPSTRLSGLGDELSSVALSRSAEPTALARLVRGDLDWVTMKALDRERTRRYESAGSLASDIDRFLNHEPVDAGPPTVGYRLKKFARRHRGAVTAAFVLGSILTAGAIGTAVVLARMFDAQRREAAALAQTDAIHGFFRFDVLAAAAPSSDVGAGRDATILEVLQRAASKLDEDAAAGGRFADSPAVESGIRLVISSTFMDLGEPDLARPHLDRARELQTQIEPPDESSRLAVEQAYARMLQMLGEYSDALALIRSIRPSIEALNGVDHVDTLAAQHLEGIVLNNLGRPHDALPILRDAETRTEAMLGPTDPGTRRVQATVADCLLLLGRAADALEVRQSIHASLLEERGPDDPDTIRAAARSADLLSWAGDAREALREARALVDPSERVFGPNHRTSLSIQKTIGVTLYQLGELDESERVLRDVVERRAEHLGELFLTTIDARIRHANALSRLGRLEESDALHKLAIAQFTEVYGPEAPRTLFATGALAASYRRSERLDLAEPLLRDLIPRLQASAGKNHHDTLGAMHRLVEVLSITDRREEALELSQEVLARQQDVLNPHHFDLLSTKQQMGWNHWKLGRRDIALTLIQEAYEGFNSTHGPLHDGTLRAATSIANIHRDSGTPEEAPPWYRIAIDGRVATLGTTHQWVIGLRGSLVRVLVESSADEKTIEDARRDQLAALIERADPPDATASHLIEAAFAHLSGTSDGDMERSAEYARRAVDVSGGVDPGMLDTLARAEFGLGNVDVAVEIQERVIGMIPTDHPEYAGAIERLEKYRTALDRSDIADSP